MGLDETTQQSERGPLVLEIVLPSGTRVMPLPESGSLVVGRSSTADVTIDDESLSRAHARLDLGPQLAISDLGSKNGTFVRGRRVASDDRVLVGVEEPIEVGRVLIRIARAPNPAVDRVERRASGTGRALLDAPEGWFDAPSAAMRAVLDAIAQVAPTDLSVLLLGETGVGKEVCAEQIHRSSKRATGTLLRLNCAAIPDTLLESELFGYERGAFTGATAAKPGLIESADGGTVFLDEIGELPAAVQVKLLRVLDRREVMRIGAMKPRTVDVRFVAATHRSLDAEIAAGRFRADLLYRLAGMTIRIPPLRERPDEIHALARRFAADTARRLESPVPALSPQALEVLVAHTWPGNIRELRNVIERAAIVSRGAATMEPEHLAILASRDTAPFERPSSTLREQVDTLERTRVLETLEACGGNRSEAARRLGMSRGALLARLRAWGVGPEK
ncbi:MAG: sigma 54-interacting transcriptional regulator [Myxococcales bacterium]|nr:sigma 54-interacting transcriptional regulator [Myxococcales bacterium]